MKTFQKLSISLISILVINIPIYAQMFEIDFDKLKIGSQYKVLIKNGWETEGELIKKDSNSIDIKTEYKIFTIPKSEIKDLVDASSEFRVIHEPDQADNEPDQVDNVAEITDTTKKCNLVTIFKKKYTDVQIYGLSDSSVKISKNEYSKEILIKDIKSITFNGGGFWKGAAIGGGIGLLTGILIGIDLKDLCDGQEDCERKGIALAGLVFAIPSALIGGGLVELLAKDKIYNLSNLDFEAKRKKIKYIIKEYSDS